ncbi:histidine kinase [Nocardia sp. NPDC005998]|uniref:sensor histidine kinase n=1 Tax=Nocardia sp. NPDC005998 TaxID=3156894 RepID=UPI0033A71B7A
MFGSGIAGSTPTLLSRLLRLVGAGALAAFLPTYHLADLGVPVLLAVGLAGIGMLTWALAPADRHRLNRIALALMVVFGGLTVAQYGGSSVAMLAAVYGGFAVVQHSTLFGALLTATAALAVSISYPVAQAPAGVFAAMLAAIAVVALMGVNRRQFRVSAEQNRLLVEQSRAIRAERDRAAALAERGRIAREVHDVLAHTLGGLVLQLDAADALLEAGETEQAGARVRSSRALAASGLADARQVVGALRAERLALPTELERLAREHRDAGGQLRLHCEGNTDHLDEQVSTALLRAAQESLTNARKHAPGTEVELRLRIEADQVELTASNPLPRRTRLLSANARSTMQDASVAMQSAATQGAVVQGVEMQAVVVQDAAAPDVGAQGMTTRDVVMQGGSAQNVAPHGMATQSAAMHSVEVQTGVTQGTAAPDAGAQGMTTQDVVMQGVEVQTVAAQDAAARDAGPRGMTAQDAVMQGGSAQNVATQGEATPGAVAQGVEMQAVVAHDAAAPDAGAWGMTTQGAVMQGGSAQNVATQGEATPGAVTQGVEMQAVVAHDAAAPDAGAWGMTAQGAVMQGGSAQNVATQGLAIHSAATKGVEAQGAAAQTVATLDAVMQGEATSGAVMQGATAHSSGAGDLVGMGVGAGLLGMRERIGGLGGTVVAGKVGGRWVVRMMVPRR